MDVGGAVAKRMEELQRSVDPTVMAIQKIDSVTQNMNSAIDKFVDTGKFSFADFSRSIIQDIIKIELKAQATKLFSSLISTGGSFLGSLLGFANGGNPPVNKPSIVGENGPELFVPRTAGTIVPNGGGNNTAIRFNGDTGSNYGTIFLRYSGSSRDTARVSTATSGQLDSFSTLANGGWTQYEITIPNYANTNINKLAICQVGFTSSGGDYTTSRWTGTAAINSITLYSGNPSFSFQSGTTMSLFGIEKA
jgi:hypothetical protein